MVDRRAGFAAGREAWHFWIRGELVADLGETVVLYLGRYTDTGVARWAVHFEDRRPRFMLEVAEELIVDEELREAGQEALVRDLVATIGTERLCVRVDGLGANAIPCWDGDA